jgi:26S proteasome regulatory subunit N13
LLQPLTTLPVIDKADEKYIDELLSHVPRTLLVLAQEATDNFSSVDATSETAQAAMAALSAEQKKGVLRKVLRSAQFSQSLGSLTMALRDGGLPTISDALKIKVANGGYMAHGGMPLGGGDAVEAFLQGIKSTVEEANKDGGDARQRA